MLRSVLKIFYSYSKSLVFIVGLGACSIIAMSSYSQSDLRLISYTNSSNLTYSKNFGLFLLVVTLISVFGFLVEFVLAIIQVVKKIKERSNKEVVNP